MNARIKNPAMTVPDAMGPLVGLGKLLGTSPLPAAVRGLVHLRASQINGCAVCIDLEVTKTKESPQRLAAVAAWYDAPFFTDAERAALALTEAVTRLADRTDPVPDPIWNEAAKHYDETALAYLVLEISVINLYNRINVATRQVAGAQRW